MNIWFALSVKLQVSVATLALCLTEAKTSIKWLLVASAVAFTTSGCTTLPTSSLGPASTAPVDTDTTRLGVMFQELERSHSPLSGFLGIDNGLDAFAARAILTEEADQTIDAQYFILEDDIVGRSFLGLLHRAAERGVRVRLLVDDYHLSKEHDRILAGLAAHPNFHVRIINPFYRSAPRAAQIVTRFGSVTRRMHNKSFIADNQVAVVGGRNIGNEYFNANPEVAFGDFDVLSTGPVVQRLSIVFDEYWNSEAAYPIANVVVSMPTEQQTKDVREAIEEYLTINKNSEYATALRDSSFTKSFKSGQMPFLWAKARVIADSPEKLLKSRNQTELHLSGDMSLLFQHTGREVIIFTPYFIPGDAGVEGLSKLVSQGVQVRILTNSLLSNDMKIVHAHYAKYRNDLLKAGIELFELKPNISKGTAENRTTVLHSKLFVFDRQSVFVGSLNMDPRSWRENTEMGVVIDSEELAKEIGQWFDHEASTVAYRLRLTNSENGDQTLVWEGSSDSITNSLIEPETSIWDRIWMRFLRMLPIESQL